MATKKQIITKHRARYRQASKGEKSKILDSLAGTTALSREHLSRVLRYAKGIAPNRPCLWRAPDALNNLERWGEIRLEDGLKTQLLSVSATTLDRLLKSDRKTLSPFGRAVTKPGTLLKRDIPIRRGSDWDDATLCQASSRSTWSLTVATKTPVNTCSHSIAPMSQVVGRSAMP